MYKCHRTWERYATATNQGQLQTNGSQFEIDSTSNIYVEYDCVDTTRNVATFPILNGIFIHPWFLVKANTQGLLCIKGAGTPEAAVFSETQFGADQTGIQHQSSKLP